MSTRLASRLLALAVIATASPASADVDALGQFTQSFDLSVPAFHELAPAMSLRYRSGGGDGLVGAGWSLAAGSQIQRLSRTHGVARMDASDVYVLDGEELIPCAANSASPSCTSAVASSGSSSGFYSTRVESFRRVQFLFNAFVVWDPDGTHSIYMSYDGGYTYLLARQLDVHANMVDYHYACTTTCVLDSITYPGTTIQLYREGRPDPVVLPNRQWLAQRLHSIAIVENGSLLRAYRLGYAQSLANGQSLLSSVQQVGNDAAIDASGNVTGGTAMPPVTFTSPSLLSAGSGPTVTAISTPDLSQIPATNVTALSPRFASEQVTYTVGEHWNALAGDFVPNPYGVVVGDFDGDGRADWLSWVTQNNSCTGLETETILESKSAHQAMVKWDFVPNGLAVFDCATHVWVADMDGDHRDDLLVSGQGHLSVLYSQGDGTFLLSSVGPTAGDVKRCAVGDFDGDGRPDLAALGPSGVAIFHRR